MSAGHFIEGAHDIGSGCFAYLQPDGGWGYSNAGLVTYGGGAFLVDTLIDMPRTRAMLQAFRRATPMLDGSKCVCCCSVDAYVPRSDSRSVAR